MHELSYQRGRGLKLNKTCILKHPTLGEIEEMGYEEYNRIIYSLTSTSKDIADILWFEAQIWYEDIKSEWSFFLEKELADTKKIMINIDLDGYQDTVEALAVNDRTRDCLNYFCKNTGEYVFIQKALGESDTQIILFNTKTDNDIIYIDEDCFKFTEVYYNIVIDYLRKINWIKPEYDFLKGGNKNAKIYILKHQYKKRTKKVKECLTMDSMVSSLIAKGVPYREIWDYPIYMIYDEYYRQVKITDYQNTMSALYAGGIDTKKNPINWEKIDWSSVITVK